MAAATAMLVGISDCACPIKQLLGEFATATQCGPADDPTTIYGKVVKRVLADRSSEFRAQDIGGDPHKHAFVTWTVGLVHPTTSDHLKHRAVHDGLCGRLIRAKLDATNSAMLGSGEDDGSAGGGPAMRRLDVRDLCLRFLRVYPDYTDNTQVKPVTRREEHHTTNFGGGEEGESVGSHTKIVRGGGTDAALHPWRGDEVVEIVMSDDLLATINNNPVPAPITARTIPWDLQLEHQLTSYETCAGAAAILLRHPNGSTYHLHLSAVTDEGGVAGGVVVGAAGGGVAPVFADGLHVYMLAGLGAAKPGSNKKGDLYLVLQASCRLAP